MFRKLSHLLLFISLIGFTSCVDDPIACFECNSDTAEINESIFLNNCSTNSDQYDWNFGDSTLSSDINPIHIYTDTGEFFIELKSYSNLKGTQDEIIKPIIIINPSDKFIGNYLINFNNNDALLKIEPGLTLGSVILKINSVLFCNATSSKNSLIIEPQNFWNEEFYQISQGLGTLNENEIEINIIVIDEDENESIIHITGQKLSI